MWTLVKYDRDICVKRVFPGLQGQGLDVFLMHRGSLERDHSPSVDFS